MGNSARTARTARTVRTISAALPALALALPLAGAQAQAQAQALHVRVAPQEALEPKWLHQGERIAGICPDIMAALERIEPRLRFAALGRSRSLPGIEAGLATGTLDAACGLVSSPRRRAIGQAVGQPIFQVRHLLAVRRNDPVEVATVADLVALGELVTTQRASVFSQQLRAAGVRIDDATDDNRVNLRKMLAGHGRFAYVNDLTLQYLLRHDGLQDRVRVLPVVLADEPTWFWVSRKADPALAPVLGAALDKLKASGELDRIYARWAALR